MSKDFPAIPTTRRTSRVYVDQYNDSEVWLSIQVANGSANVALTREQAQLMIDQLTEIVSDLPVTAEEVK